MLEWLKRHAWKACIRQKRIPSSNLGHSAKKSRNQYGFCFFCLSNLDDYGLFKIKLMSKVTSVTFNVPSPFMSA